MLLSMLEMFKKCSFRYRLVLLRMVNFSSNVDFPTDFCYSLCWNRSINVESLLPIYAFNEVGIVPEYCFPTDL